MGTKKPVTSSTSSIGSTSFRRNFRILFASGSDGSDIDAISHRNQIYIVKSRMKSASRLERALLHEGTHGGINQMFSDVSVSKALNAMFEAMGGSEDLTESLTSLVFVSA